MLSSYWPRMLGVDLYSTARGEIYGGPIRGIAVPYIRTDKMAAINMFLSDISQATATVKCIFFQTGNHEI